MSNFEIVARRFRESGVSIAAWSRANGFNPKLVYQVLKGQRRALRGQTHDIAVKLGIKKGTLRADSRLAA